MSDRIRRLFHDFDTGKISRRELIQALSMAALIAPVTAALGQETPPGRRGGRAIAPEDTLPDPAPFQPTGWKTVWCDHLTYRTTDYKKAAAFYATLMGWRIRSDNGSQAVMDIADRVGNAIFTGGYQPQTPPPGGGRGGPIDGAWDNFCWGIDQWDTNKVESALKGRGLDPVADHGGDFKSFHVKDPDGFDLQISNGNRENRWKGPANGKLPAPAPFESTGWKTLWLDHISFQCTDWKRSLAFYQALLGWTPRTKNATQAITDIGDVGGIIIRNAFRGGRGGRGRGAGPDSAGGPPTPPPPPPHGARIDHISFGITPWDADTVERELIKRKLGRMQSDGHLQPDTGGGGDIHTSKFQSYHTPDPFNWDLQISNITFETRGNT